MESKYPTKINAEKNDLGINFSKSKKIDFVKLKNEMKSHIIIDGRNLFKDKKLKELGFAYRVVGKP